jgi:hypothetical protein
METIGPTAELHAQRLHVLDVFVQRVAGRVAAGRAALAAVVEHSSLHRVGQRAEGGLEAGVVAARAAVDDESHRALAHARAVGTRPAPRCRSRARCRARAGAWGSPGWQAGRARDVRNAMRRMAGFSPARVVRAGRPQQASRRAATTGGGRPVSSCRAVHGPPHFHHARL